jgi:hypothetical protein
MKNLFSLAALLLLSSLLYIGCGGDENPANTVDNSDIPRDPGGSAPGTTFNNVIPSALLGKTPGNESRIRINLLGVLDPRTNTPITLTANQSVFITEDGTLKGIRVTNAGQNNQLAADVVFTVDNSGSMGEEADTIAAKIIAFADFLSSRGINLRVGCVGYDGRANGGINLTTAANLRTYLTRPGFRGTNRTDGFSGSDSARLATAARTFASAVSGENGVVGVNFADSLFSWRQGAQRVYINFTDEPTQAGGNLYWTAVGLRARWTPFKGTIHTVWSGGADTSRLFGSPWPPSNLDEERPWLMSTFTGGTLAIVLPNASNLNLTTLPVTGALANSQLVEYLTSNPNVPHTVTVTVRRDSLDGRTTLNNLTYQ